MHESGALADESRFVAIGRMLTIAAMCIAPIAHRDTGIRAADPQVIGALPRGQLLEVGRILGGDALRPHPATWQPRD